MAITTASGSDVRVRFCPFPTGTPHVGMVRTCLLNYAYARHVGGTFVFRIEDTDAARDSSESFEQIIESLKWLGLDSDEGVGIGGPHGPYRQSERTEIYKDVAAKLLAGGYAYESSPPPKRSRPVTRRRVRTPSLVTTATIGTSPTSKRQPSALRAASPFYACACPIRM